MKFARGHPEIIKVADDEVDDFLVAAVTRQGERSRNDLFSEARQAADSVRPP